MKSYEIERKYLIHTIPFDLKEYVISAPNRLSASVSRMTLSISLTNPKG